MNYFEIDYIFTRYIFPLEEDIILIAHGNFGQFQKYLTKDSKKESFPMEKFYQLEEKLFEYIQIVVESYLEDVNFINS